MNDEEKGHCAKLISAAGGSKDGGDLGAEITRQQAAAVSLGTFRRKFITSKSFAQLFKEVQ